MFRPGTVLYKDFFRRLAHSREKWSVIRSGFKSDALRMFLNLTSKQVTVVPSYKHYMLSIPSFSEHCLLEICT